MKANKWNYQTHKYEPTEIADTVLYTENMSLIVHCAQCGKEIMYGDGYTSMEIHTSLGLGYPVCEDCHAQELERRFQQ